MSADRRFGRGYLITGESSAYAQKGDVIQGHVCNCIGCCELCGSCRTWGGHTPEYCNLLKRQASERHHLRRKS